MEHLQRSRSFILNLWYQHHCNIAVEITDKNADRIIVYLCKNTVSCYNVEQKTSKQGVLMIYCFLGSKFNFSYADIWSDMPKCKLILKNRNLKYWFCLCLFLWQTQIIYVVPLRWHSLPITSATSRSFLNDWWSNQHVLKDFSNNSWPNQVNTKDINIAAFHTQETGN